MNLVSKPLKYHHIPRLTSSTRCRYAQVSQSQRSFTPEQRYKRKSQDLLLVGFADQDGVQYVDEAHILLQDTPCLLSTIDGELKALVTFEDQHLHVCFYSERADLRVYDFSLRTSAIRASSLPSSALPASSSASGHSNMRVFSHGFQSWTKSYSTDPHKERRKYSSMSRFGMSMIFFDTDSPLWRHGDKGVLSTDFVMVKPVNSRQSLVLGATSSEMCSTEFLTTK